MTSDAGLYYGAAWIVFGALHSLFSGASAKARLRPLFGPYYRIAFNLFALAAIVGVLAVGGWAYGAPRRLETIVPGAAMTGLGIVGWALMVFALREYDLGRFGGWTQVRNARSGVEEPEDEPLVTGGLHAYVRHPIYSAAFLILWGSAATDLGLATALWASLYLLIGARFEERRLRRLYGDAYGAYAERTPAFIPWRGRLT